MNIANMEISCLYLGEGRQSWERGPPTRIEFHHHTNGASDDSDEDPTDLPTDIRAQLKETLQQKSHIAGHYGSHQPQTSGSIRVNKNSQLAVTEVNPDFFWDEYACEE